MSNAILVVDDDDSIRKLVSRVLQREGFRVTPAIDGQDAIEILARERFDGCVLDLMMPRVDGLGVLKFMRENDPRMVGRTVVVTAYPRTARSLELDEVCEVVTKPFEVQRLVAAVRVCVDDAPLG